MDARPWCLGDDLYRVDVVIIDRWECPSHLSGCLVHNVAHVPEERRFQARATMSWPDHQHRRHRKDGSVDDNDRWTYTRGVRQRWVYGRTAEEARFRLAERREREGWAHYPPSS